MSKLAPRPWTISEFDIGTVMIFDANERAVATVGDEAVAKIILKCGNMHEEVINLLDQLIEDFKNPSECGCDGAPDAMYACYFHRNEDAIRRMLKKAEAE